MLYETYTVCIYKNSAKTRGILYLSTIALQLMHNVVFFIRTVKKEKNNPRTILGLNFQKF